MIALIDCNNFFASCERLFRPDLANTPIVVLSSNDGCVIARSNEVKALGVKMAGAVYQYRDLFRQHNVVQFSANFELYGNISKRIVVLLTAITPAVEVYSIDEAFLNLDDLEITDYQDWGIKLASRIEREVGIPVSIGIAPTKTLAKLAAEQAKKRQQLASTLASQANLDKNTPTDPEAASRSSANVLALTTPSQIAARTANTAVRDVWGIGRKLAPKLLAEGVYTAYDLAHMRPQRARQLMGINGQITASELTGIMCIPLQTQRKPQQMVMRGRQFGRDISDLRTLEAALASLTARAARALRKEERLARSASFRVCTNWRKPGYKTLWSCRVLLPPSNDTGQISSLLAQELQRLFKPGLAFHRADVFLYDLVAPQMMQLDIFGFATATHTKSVARMKMLDKVNQQHGINSLRYAAETLSIAWIPKKAQASPNYTCRWSDLPTVYAI